MANDCILWRDTIDVAGYGRAGHNVYAHRAVYEANFGGIPAGFVVHHTCETKACVNPEHLRAISHAEHNALHLNAAPYYARLRAITHCPHGHPYSPSNTFRRKDGRRECRTCMRDRARRYRKARVA